MKKTGFILVLLVLVMVLSGCYYRKEVQTNEVGLVMADGVTISSVVGAGRYTDMGYYADLQLIDASALTVEWNDPDLVTKDKQPIGFKVSVTFARKRDADSVKEMWELYNSEARNNEVLAQQVVARIPRVAKEITTRYTLDEMLGISGEVGRSGVQDDMATLLQKELDDIYVQLYDLGINNIEPSAAYLQLLEDKANAQAAVEVAEARKEQKEADLQTEKAQTNIEIELAKRERQVAAEKAKIYDISENWYRLEYLRRLDGVIGDNDKLWFFVEPGLDLTLLLNGENVVPVEK